MNGKRVIVICATVLLVIAAVVVAVVTLLPGKSAGTTPGTDASGTKSLPAVISTVINSLKPSAKIKSDGKTYQVKKLDAVTLATGLDEQEKLPVVGDMETLLKLLKDRGALYDGSVRNYNTYGGGFFDGKMVADYAVSEAAPVPSAAPPASAPAEAGNNASFSSAGDADYYSETNEQVAGVNEGDIVKTDGKYIYALSPENNMLRIISADGADVKVVATIDLQKTQASEFYLVGGDRLVIVGYEYIPANELPIIIDGGKTYSEKPAEDYYGWYTNNFTSLSIYDISDREAPAEVRSVSMDGWSVSTRVIGNVVYMVTNKNIWNIAYDNADSPLIRPYCKDTEVGEGFEPLGLDCVYYIPDTTDSSYLLIGALDVYGDDPFEPVAYLGAGSNFYMSRNAMYITKWRWDESVGGSLGAVISPRSYERTDILRFAVDGTNVVYTGTGTVDGSPINQYSMDEYDGYFRIATTDRSTGTYVTVLDVTNMRMIGRTEPLAPGETMQSMRFAGDMGYVVTFRNMDPLFTINLSDPANPRVLGELKIPGFSQYLHPLGSGLMLGIGRDTQEVYTRDKYGVETVVGAQDVGMKASLFDVSDPFNPVESDVLSLGDGWSEVSYNARALMCDKSRGVYGFVTERWNNRGWSEWKIVLLQVDAGESKLMYAVEPGYYTGEWIGNCRLCYIGDTLYLVHGRGVIVYEYATLAQLGSIWF